MTNSNEKISKFLSYVLRHQPEAIGLTLDNEGWAEVDALLVAAQKHGQPFSRLQLQTVVDTNDKKRFTLSEDSQRIRAAQGHSTQQVAITYSPIEPPEFLFHGTALRFLDPILQHGLLPASRHHVHLSGDKKTAINVGKRHGKPVVLIIDAQKMHQEGYQFYQAENGVWLTESVPPRFFHCEEI